MHKRIVLREDDESRIYHREPTHLPILSLGPNPRPQTTPPKPRSNPTARRVISSANTHHHHHVHHHPNPKKKYILFHSSLAKRNTRDIGMAGILGAEEVYLDYNRVVAVVLHI